MRTAGGGPGTHVLALQMQLIGRPPAGGPLEAEADSAGAAIASGRPVGQLSAVPPQSGSTIVDDEAMPGPGQVRRSQFMDVLEARLCAVIDTELPETGADGCTDLAYYVRVYRGRTASEIERAIRLWSSPRDASGEALADAVVERVREATRRYRTTGRIEELPSGQLGAAGAGIAAYLQLKPSGRQGGTDPAAVLGHLGAGSPLEPATRSRMESSFGQSFAGVRIHTDATAAGIADELGARAFTVGQQIAFGAGELRAGTPSGDVLLAHELAHTIQQAGGASAVAEAPLEAEADLAAGRAFTGDRVAVERRTGLTLQSCSKKKSFAERLGALTSARDVASELRAANAEELRPLAGPTGSLVGDGLAWERALRARDWSRLVTLFGTDPHSFWAESRDRVVEEIVQGRTPITITATPGFSSWVEARFMDLVALRTGFQLVLELLATGQPVELRSGSDFTTEIRAGGELTAGRYDTTTGRPGTAAGSTVTLDPSSVSRATLGRVGGRVQIIDETDTMAFGHELIHALHNARGENIGPLISPQMMRGTFGGKGLARVPETGEAESPEELRTITGQTRFDVIGRPNPANYNLPAGVTENALRAEAGLDPRVSHSGGVRHTVVPVRQGETIDQLVARYRFGGRAVPPTFAAGVRAVIVEWYGPRLTLNGMPAGLSQLALPTGAYIALYFLARGDQNSAADAAGLTVQ